MTSNRLLKFRTLQAGPVAKPTIASGATCNAGVLVTIKGCGQEIDEATSQRYLPGVPDRTSLANSAQLSPSTRQARVIDLKMLIYHLDRR